MDNNCLGAYSPQPGRVGNRQMDGCRIGVRDAVNDERSFMGQGEVDRATVSLRPEYSLPVL